ncbi:MAG: hypothetical protein HKN76_18595, partial [Saprospiraceae bacterium]|nr:hypothetical protein [Saprospiraceae bacterium]
MHSDYPSTPIRKLLAIVCCLAGMIFILAASFPWFSPGITNPEPIGPYLNGVFPNATPGSGAAEGNWMVVEAYP